MDGGVGVGSLEMRAQRRPMICTRHTHTARSPHQARLLLAPDILAPSGPPAGSSVTETTGPLHNAVRRPLSSVQGPPGWGSTQVRSMHVGIRETFSGDPFPSQCGCLLARRSRLSKFEGWRKVIALVARFSQPATALGEAFPRRGRPDPLSLWPADKGAPD